MLPETVTRTVGGYTIQLRFHEPRPITTIQAPKAKVDVKNDVRSLYGALMKARRNRRATVPTAWGNGNNMQVSKGANAPPKRKRNNNNGTPKSPQLVRGTLGNGNNRTPKSPNAKRPRVNKPNIGLPNNFKPVFTAVKRPNVRNGIPPRGTTFANLLGPRTPPRTAWGNTAMAA